MQGDRTKILVESIKRLLRRNAVIHLQKIVNKTHAADLSVVFPSLPIFNQHKLFDMITDIQQKGVLFSELDEDTLLNFIEGIELDEFVEILENMASDDVADLIGRLPEEKAAAVLEKMEKGSEEVEGLLRYKDDTAGGIMVPDFIALKQDTTAGGAIESLQTDHSDVEMPFYLYVVDEYGKLVGVCSLRQLVVVPPEIPLKEFMSTNVFSVQTDTDQEEVAKLVARYDILAVPVVNRTNVLEGIVTVDDVIDIFRAEATEDFLKMAGVSGDEFVETKSVIKSMRIRLPWLFASCVGGIFAFFVIGRFEESLTQFTYLAAFIPVIMGMGGNIGTQSSTIVVRGLATGLLDIRDIWSVVFKELAVGFILGIVYGTLIAVVAQLQYGLIAVASSVSLSVLCSMSVAALVGSLVPMLFARINIDPAVATGPFVTTSIDIISVFFYFKIATTFLAIGGG